MRKIISVLVVTLMSSTIFAAEISCKMEVIDTSSIGVEEEQKKVVVKSGKISKEIEKDGSSLFYSIPATDWKDYKTFYITAYVNELGDITEAMVIDELYKVSVPMNLNSNNKKAHVKYHGGRLDSEETFDVEASCEVK